MASVAQPKMQLSVLILLLVSHAMAVGATPPGIAINPSRASCKIKKYKYCYNLEHVCPKFCPGGECTVNCVSCKPVCLDGTTAPISAPSVPDSPPDDTTPPPTPPTSYTPPSPPTPPTTYTPPSPPPSEPTPPTSYTPPSSPTPPTNTPPSSPTPPTNTPSSSPTPPTTYSPPTTYTPPSPPSPPIGSQNPPPPSPSTPPTTYTPPSPPSSPTGSLNPPPSPSTPPTTYSPPSPPSSPTGSLNTPPSPTQAQNPPPSPKTVKCKNKNYPQCYNIKHVCPSSCPGGCEVDCVTCKPVCMCQDPRFIGGDGITFYFHGKKDQDFCLVSDSNLHINAHFIGRRNENMKRDFTWVQSIAILFDEHQLFLGALRTSTWDDSIDRLTLTFDGNSINLPETEGAKWQPANVPTVSITRATDTNNVIVEVERKLKITAKVVPITEEDSRIHNYGITKEDCFAHLDLGFKFYSLSNEVNGVLGQTYKPGYVSHLNIGAKMPVMGGDKDFQTSSLFAPDCAVSRFTGINEYGSLMSSEMPELSCASGINGRGVVCKR